MENLEDEGFSEEIIKLNARRVSVKVVLGIILGVLVGILGYVLGSASGANGLSAVVAQAWSEMFSGSQGDWVEVVEVNKFVPGGTPPDEPDRVVVGGDSSKTGARGGDGPPAKSFTPKRVTKDVVELEVTSVIFDVEGADDGLERVKILNRGVEGISLENFSLQYLRIGGASSAARKKNFEPGDFIPAGDNFVVGMSCSAAVPCAGVDMSWSQTLANDGGTVYMVSDQEVVSGDGDPDILCRLHYGVE